MMPGGAGEQEMLDTRPDGGEPETETLLEINNIEVIYNHVILVLKGVSLSVPKGGIIALLGGNGAGKPMAACLDAGCRVLE